jgi:hypothetical protein
MESPRVTLKETEASGRAHSFYVVRLLVYGVVPEGFALWSLFVSHQAWHQLLLFAIGHLLASVAFALLLVAGLPSRFVILRRGAFGYFFCINFFIPIFGALGMFALLLYFRFFQRPMIETEFFSLPLPSYTTEVDKPASGMGEGGAWSRLRSVALPRVARIKALMAVGMGSGLNTTRLLQFASSDNDDEVRLLAFNLYDRREKVISAAISTSLKALHATADRAEQVRLCRALAFAYWEVLYNGMANDELAEFFAGEAITYANRAIQLGGDDAGLSVLLGRIHLWKGELEAAEVLIRAALEQGAYRDRVISYLAEFAYRKRDFKTLRLYFRSYPSLCYKPGIGPVASFWRE